MARREASWGVPQASDATSDVAPRDHAASDVAARIARDLTVAIVHHGTPDVLETCLEHVAAAAQEARTVVIDVDSGHDPRTEAITSRAGAQRIAVPNLAYAHAVNAALHACDTPYLAFLNADVFVRPETFANLLHACRAPGVAAAGPLVRDGDDRLQNQGLPYRWHQWVVRSGRPWTSVPWLSGCLQVVRMEAVAGPTAGALPSVGGMNETFRFYNEDLEWGWRLTGAGWRLRLVATPATHLGGNATPPGRDAFLVEGLRGGYVLSQRYRPSWFRAVHRWVVMLWAALQERFGPAERRRAHRAIRWMFAEKRFEDSPFGSTLTEENPVFWNQVP